MTDDYWAKRYDLYTEKDWITKPSLFAQTVKGYLPKSGSILELSAGVGQDSAYFAGLGYSVTATDIDMSRLKELADNGVAILAVDLRQPLRFADASFDVAYAHLSLHYFDKQTTEAIFAEIYRVLKPDGLLVFLANSTDDPEYNTGKQIEPDYFEVDGSAKRYLTTESAKQFANAFKPVLVDNNGETYKDSAKGVHNLIRFIGTK